MLTTKEPASQIGPLGHQLVTSPCYWLLSVPALGVVSFMERTGYLGTKVREQLESQTACFPLCLSCTSPWAPPPWLPQVPSQLPSCCWKGWLVGGGEGIVPCLHSHGQGSEASSALHLGVLKRQCIHLWASPEPPAFPSQGQEQGFQTWRILDGREPSRSSRTTPSEQ